MSPSPPVPFAPPGATPVVPWRRRLLLLATVGYVGALAVWVDGGAEPRAWMMALLALGIASFTARWTGRVARALGWGLAVVVASLGAVGDSRGLDACGALGAMVCAVAACMAVARIPGSGGVVRAAPMSPRPAAAVVGVLWGIALVARLAPEREATSWMTDAPRAWALTAGVASVAVLLVVTEWTLRRRRLELAFARFHICQHQQIFRQPLHARAIFQDAAQKLRRRSFLRVTFKNVLQQNLHISADGRQRCAKLM